MIQILIEDETIKLCKTQPQDVDEILMIEAPQQDEMNRRYVYLWTKERHLQSIEMDDELHATIFLKRTNEIIGYIILSGLRSEHDVIEFDRIALKTQGKGYGKKAVKLIKKLAFEKLKCNRLWLDVFEYNVKAKTLYESEGFIHEGTLRECKKYHNNYYGMHVMSMLKNEYYKFQK